MNAADEHGIIHPGTCPHPITGGKRPTASTAKDTKSSCGNSNGTPTGEAASAPGDCSSLQSKPITNSKTLPSDAPNAEGGGGDDGGVAGDNKKETLAGGGGGGSVPQAAGEVVRPILLSALQEISELARPEIAASAVVAGACKVTREAISGRAFDFAGRKRHHSGNETIGLKKDTFCTHMEGSMPTWPIHRIGLGIANSSTMYTCITPCFGLAGK